MVIKHIASTGETPYLWIPGFAYDWQIFKEKIDHTPGQHWTINWSESLSFHQFSQQVLAQMPNQCKVRGWSLGGAIAMQLQSKSQHTQVLACQRQFCHPNKVPETALQAFRQQIKRSPTRALKHFQKWCDFHIPPTVNNTQILLNTLNWLEQYYIADWQNVERVYAKHDQLVEPDRQATLVEGGHASVLAAI